MKKVEHLIRSTAFTILGAVMFASCQSDPEELSPSSGTNSPSGGELATIYVQSEGSIDGRTQLGETEGGVAPVEWLEDDKIAIFAEEGSSFVEYTVATIDPDNASSSSFKGDKIETTPICAIYPSAIAKGHNSIELPATQSYVEGNVANGSMPMYSVITEPLDDADIKFKNIAGIFNIRLTTSETSLSVSKIEVFSSESIAGVATVSTDGDDTPSLSFDGAPAYSVVLDCGSGVALSSVATDFYIVLPPAEVTGFTVTSTAGDVMSLYPQSSKNIERNVIATTTSLDFVVEDLKYNTDTYEIYSAKGLQAFADLVNGEKNTLSAKVEDAAHSFDTYNPTINGTIMNDIDMSAICSSGNSWLPIGYVWGSNRYTGIFNGGGYTISNLYFEADTTSPSGKLVDKKGGLFASANGATIKNVKLKGVTITGSTGNQTAALAGNAQNCTIESCSVLSGSVSGAYNVAGIVGWSNGTTYTDCYNGASITATSNSAAGIAARVAVSSTGTDSFTSAFTRCENEGAIVSTNNYAGGIVAYAAYTDGYINNLSISSCSNSGKVSSTSGIYVGGIVGETQASTTISNSTNYNSVTGASTYVGGVVGYADNKLTITECDNEGAITSGGDFIGGIVGYIINNTYATTITDCSNSGVISTDAGEAGGVVGRAEAASTIKGCSNTQTVTAAQDAVGGIVGRASVNTSQILNCYNTAEIKSTGSTTAGGVAGIIQNSSSVIGCYNTANVSSTNFTGGLVGHTQTGTVAVCYNSGIVSNTTTGVNYGGVTGYVGYPNGTTASVTVEACFNTASATNTDSANISIIGVAGNNLTLATNANYAIGDGNGDYGIAVSSITEINNNYIETMNAAGSYDYKFLAGSGEILPTIVAR